MSQLRIFTSSLAHNPIHEDSAPFWEAKRENSALNGLAIYKGVSTLAPIGGSSEGTAGNGTGRAVGLLVRQMVHFKVIQGGLVQKVRYNLG